MGPMCGSTECPILEEAHGYGLQHCCVDTRCGVVSEEAFGQGLFPAPCLPRDDYPLGVEDDSCRFDIPFVEIVGCCRPDGRCGLMIEAPNWREFGCMERTEFARHAKNNLALAVNLLINGRPYLLDEIDEKACTFPR